MDIKSTKYLPGGFDQYITFNKNVDLTGKNILFIGSGLEKLLLKADISPYSFVHFIVDDYDSLMTARFVLKEQKDINIRMMEYANTDFYKNEFDIVYVQGSVTSENKNKTVKEIKRILKPGGLFCVSENFISEKDVPQFINDVFENSGVAPLMEEDIIKFYTERNFQIIFENDLSYTLKKYYKNWKEKLDKNLSQLTEDERKQNKKLLKRIGHESKAYLELGGAKYMGFKMLILKKGKQ